jgi:hypothetical protein
MVETLTRQEQIAFFMELRHSIPEFVHPAGAATIDHWIADAIDAAANSDFVETERLRKMIHDKIELEHVGMKWIDRRRRSRSSCSQR